LLEKLCFTQLFLGAVHQLCSFICLFDRTDIVAMVSHERLEQSRRSLQRVFTRPYWCAD